MTLNQLIQPCIDIYHQGGITVIPLAILSVVGFAIFLQKTFNIFRRIATSQSSIKNNLPTSFTSKSNYYKIFISNCIKTKTPSDNFIKDTQNELNQLQNDLWIIELIIQLAPILGILGTIIGVMQSIQGVDLSQEQGMKVVSKGFSKALITSIYGLSLACIFQLIYSSLQANIQSTQNNFLRLYHEILKWETKQNESL
ncbi:MAG: MotA/TolQ/ExbB proton channel family protein [Candidatus Cloacimonetes bacterium]|nr:MotA/TolQ/ExbB proton channel family protein [Candidatus Cloacimonadota bacterium]